MRYLETALFLDVGTVTDSRSHVFRVGTDGTKVFIDPSDRAAELVPVVGMAASQTPTVVYTPMQGQSFVKRLFAPIPLPIILNAIQSGWSANRVFGVFVERINNLQNAPTASGPTPARVPEYEDFYRMTQLLSVLLREGSLTMGLDQQDQRHLVIRFFDDGRSSQAIREVKELLDLPQNRDHFAFQENLLGGTDGELRLRLRSMQSAMFYLANGVQVPQEHLDAGIITVTRYPNGEAFDWANMLDPIFTVRVAKRPPTDAFISVRHRQHWFYIADDDVTSKATFMLLTNAFSLQAGDAHTVAPTLTIPLNR
jgi:hypothetical protein